MNPTLMAVLNIGLWMTIVLLAFFMQVMPFLLVLVLLSLSFGISSATALILIPTVLFGMLVLACWYASVRTRRRLPKPLPVYRTVQPKSPDHFRGAAMCLAPFLPRNRRLEIFRDGRD
jgi:hypothetical protein